MSIKTIVAAMALQTGEDPVVGRAIQLAQQHQAKLIVLHVIEDTPTESLDLPSPIDHAAIIEVLEKEAREHLGDLFKATVTSADVLIETGRPHEVIDAIARQYKADLVVIGAGVPRNIREKVFGSTADRVVRCSGCPVLVAKSRSREPWRRVVAAVDLSDTAMSAVRSAANLAPTATMKLVHVVEIPLNFEQAMLTAGTPAAEIERYRNAKARSARQALLTAFAGEGGMPDGAQLRVTPGLASKVLVGLATRGRVDLMALGAQGKNAVSRFVLGSVARKILKSASCDVLIVPAAGDPAGCVSK